MNLLRLGGKERQGSGTTVTTAPEEPETLAPVVNELLNVVDSQRWLSREQFIGKLNDEDRTNVLAVERFLQTLPSLRNKLKSGSAGLFVVGSSALPETLSAAVLKGHFTDIDLRLVVGGVATERIVEEIESAFPTSELRGVFRKYDFPRDSAYDDIITRGRLKFFPFGNSKPVDLLLPNDEAKNRKMADFLQVHVDCLKQIKDGLQKPLCIDWEEPKLHARHTLIETFVVRLI